MTRIAEIMTSHGENNEATGCPYWAIVRKSGLTGQYVMLAGIWFNRDDAEAFMKKTHYRYPKTARVYCFSGHDSSHLREMYEIARAEAAETLLARGVE